MNKWPLTVTIHIWPKIFFGGRNGGAVHFFLSPVTLSAWLVDR